MVLQTMHFLGLSAVTWVKSWCKGAGTEMPGERPVCVGLFREEFKDGRSVSKNLKVRGAVSSPGTERRTNLNGKQVTQEAED